MTSPQAFLECTGCGFRPSLETAYSFRCAGAASGDGIDHVLARRLNLEGLCFDPPASDNPFLAYRHLFYSVQVARGCGLSDDRIVGIIQALDEAIGRVDGHGFRTTPLRSAPALARALKLGGTSLWIKDETGNVSGSHKARHLMGVMVCLRLAEASGLSVAPSAPLAIASCGNAALAAAVVAAAARRTLRVFIPPDAAPSVVARLSALGAALTLCGRDGAPGDPTYRAFQQALREGALPFCCQGPDNGLNIEGGMTLGYELAHQLSAGPGELDQLFIQVGGGALGSAVFQALAEARKLGALSRLPEIHLVQTTGAYPLKRAYDRFVERLELALGETGPTEGGAKARWLKTRLSEDGLDRALAEAAHHRDMYMRPWEGTPQSVAHGILDDETYDWLALMRAMVSTGGRPVVVTESELEQAHRAGRVHTGIDVDHTGTAGLAGVIQRQRTDPAVGEARVGVLFTGHRR